MSVFTVIFRTRHFILLGFTPRFLHNPFQEGKHDFKESFERNDGVLGYAGTAIDCFEYVIYIDVKKSPDD
ncbi:MAG: hypothetical protein OTJ44_08315 [Planctomycetota bacterium]|nr:hypothetical protein [Planctomycetota bacterium]